METRAPPRKRTAFRIFQKLPFNIYSTKAPRLPPDEKAKAESVLAQSKTVQNEDNLLKYDPLRDREAEVERRVEQDSSSEGSDDFNGNKKRPLNEFEQAHPITKYSVYISWITLIVFAWIREFIRYIGLESNKNVLKELDSQQSFPRLFNDFESTYTRNCYMRVRDVFERPIASCPGATVNILERVSDDHNWTFRITGKQTECINTGSYNYLGFAQAEGPCADAAASAIDSDGIASCSTAIGGGLSPSQHRLESLVAEFLGVEDAICFAMGFATNSLNCPALADKNTLIVSDEHNHASLRLGARLSGATVRPFKHNDMVDLERVLRDAVVYGNPKRCRSFGKIIIIVEGIYSMEGSICSLPEIIALKKKYKAYLYLDEAHSIGAMGRTGRGVVEYWDCDPTDVDILMGTFTKSFGSSGGYIAGTRSLISHLRRSTPAAFYCMPMAPPIAEQIIGSMTVIMGKDGTNDGATRIERLARNTRYFRLRLKQLGFIVYGSDDSPVVPLLVYYPTHCGVYGRAMLERGIATVVVSFPATDMTESRIRFCLSAAHTKDMLDEVLAAVDEVGSAAYSKHSYRAHLYKNKKAEW